MGLLPRSCLLLQVVALLVPATIRGQEETTTAASAACNTDICVKSCEGCDYLEQVPDPNNCLYYYVCDGAGGYFVPESLKCETGLVFNASQHKCVEGEDCESCTSPPAPECVYECEALDPDNPPTADAPVKIPILADCQHYYECVDAVTSNAIPNICPAETPFFGDGECQDDETKCCSCQPYCPLDSVAADKVPDPLDCRRYFYCTEAGSVPTLSTTCDDGEYFDSFLNDCHEEASCVTQCTNVVDASGCIEPFTCLEVGFFAKCPNRCTADYYHCTEATGTYQDVASCTGDKVFHPDDHNCVSKDACDYPL